MKSVQKDTTSIDDRKMLRAMNRRSWLLFCNFNIANFQGIGYSNAMTPAIQRFYANGSEAQKQALQRSIQFFNCTYETAPFIMGLNAALEKENSLDASFDANSINGVKAALMGPASAIGDTMFWGIVRTIAAAIAIPLAATGNFIGPILFVLLYHLASVLTRYNLMHVGYTAGSQFMKSMSDSGIIKSITFCVSIVGMIMVGAMAAQFINVHTALIFTFQSGEKLVLGDLLDKIFKGLLPLGFVFAFFGLVRKKINFAYLTLGTLAFGIVCVLLGIF
jgi:mannose/fructose/N-acetylgalactosamine-specific phosphotransferase system component IID